jgi:nucleotide-binding universal stress UspA family protein
MFDHILVPLDGSSLAECVLPHSFSLARAFGSKVTLLRVLERTHADDRPGFIDPLDWHISRTEAEAYLAGWAHRLEEGGVATGHELLDGTVADQVVDFVRDHGIDLMVLSSHGHGGLSGWNVSGTVQKIILRAYVSVMIVRAYQPLEAGLTDIACRRLLLALDGSMRAECALAPALQLARFFSCQLLVASVVSKPEVTRHRPLTSEESDLVDRITSLNRLETAGYLSQLSSRLSAEGIDVDTHLLTGAPVADILQDLAQQEQVDLVVLSAHGSSGVSKWPYGSLATNFIAYGTTPLLIIQDLRAGNLLPTAAELAAQAHRPR